MTIGPFASRDMLFCGIAGDLELYTTEEVITLRNAGIFKSSSSTSQPSLSYHHSCLWAKHYPLLPVPR